MRVTSVVARLVHFGGIGTHEAVAHLRLVAAFHEIGPDADSLLVVVGQTWRTLVLGGLAVPARVEDATVGVVGEEAVEARTVRRRDGWLCNGSDGSNGERERECRCDYPLFVIRIRVRLSEEMGR